jgi:C-terminal processing protease CtpA/Prc
MESTAFLKIGFVLALMNCGALGIQCACARDTPEATSELSVQTFGADADRGRLIWAMLDAIEREHIAPPARRELIRIVTQALTRLQDGPRGEAIDAEFLQVLDQDFLQCQTAEELTAAIERMEYPTVSFDQFIERFTQRHAQGFDKKFGEVRLIRAKDHDVEEQFRGNRYVGLGVALRLDRNSPPAFAAIIPGGPAERGGLKPNTVIHEIDGRSTENWSIEKILDGLRGPQGSDVTLKISSPNSPDEKSITLTRGVVRFDSLKTKNHEPLSRGNLRCDESEPIGWVVVADITGSTLHELRVAEIQSKANGIRVLVLDFQQSGRAEDLHQALLVADSLLDGGVIWEQTDQSMQLHTELADRECLFRGIPLVIVVDRHTGPVHCAIAAALQDAGRAKVVGESPDFQGLIASTVRLRDVPFSLIMNTIRLNRARRDRGWPLKPDVSVMGGDGPSAQLPDEILAMRMTNGVPARISRPSKPSIEPKLKPSEPASALSAVMIAGRRQVNSILRGAQSRIVGQINPVPLVQIRSKEREEIALRIARELLDALSSDQKQ